MIITFAIVIVVILGVIVGSIFAVYIPFLQNIGSIGGYNQAYYGAIAAAERALLVGKFQWVWFQWSGWRQGQNTRWPSSDASITNRQITNQNNEGIQRSIDNRSTQIPVNQGDIPIIFANNDSNQFNILPYKKTINIPLYLDTTSQASDFYKTDNIQTNYQGTQIDISVRIPPKIAQSFGSNNDILLCDTNNNCDRNNDGIYNDVLINRRINGTYNNQSINILPSTSINYASNPIQINTNQDTHIRESIINTYNNIPNIVFGNSRNPIGTDNIQSLNAGGQAGKQVQDMTFTTLFNDIQQWIITLSLDESAVTNNNNVYPFLEYKVQADQDFWLPYHNITASANTQWYQVYITIAKPIIKNTVWGSFTILF